MFVNTWGEDTSKFNSGEERDWEVVEETFYSIGFVLSDFFIRTYLGITYISF